MKLSVRIATSMLGLAAGTAMLVAWTSDSAMEAAVRPIELQQQLDFAQRDALVLEQHVAGVREDVRVTVSGLPLTTLLEAPTGTTQRAEALETIRSVLVAMLENKPEYFQARVLGPAPEGHELVRVERVNGVVRVTREQELQDKGDRDYFQQTWKLPAGRLSVSPVELNQEHGQIQVPHVPVLRVAAPVFGRQGERLGVMVINVDLRHVFDRLRAAGAPLTQTYLVNASGDFLVHADPAKEFGWELGRSATIQDEFPGAKALLDSAEPGVLDGDLVLATAKVALADGPKLTVFSVVNSTRLAAASNERRNSALAALAAVLVAAVIAVLLARSIARPITTVTDAARRLGEHDERLVLPVSGSDEVARLARALEQTSALLVERTTALRVQEAQFRSLVEVIPSAILLVDDGGTIRLVNRAAEVMFGLTREELIGTPIHRLTPERFRAAHPGNVQAYARSPTARPMGQGQDLFAVRSDGSEFPVEIGLAPVETPLGRMTLASVIDITRRKRIDDELKRSNAELEQFASVASHDLQEPLRMVANYTELLRQRYQGKLDEKADKYIHYATDGARRMQRLVTDLLAYSRVGSQGRPLEPVDAGEVLRQVQRSLEARITETGATIEHGALPRVMADEGQLHQLLQNLITNAIKFRSEAPPLVTITVQPDAGPWLHFSVRDNGIGMEMQYAEKIFLMFQRLHPVGSYEGSGIGLSIAKRIIERHGGRIWVESAPGLGTTFHFTLRKAEPVS